MTKRMRLKETVKNVAKIIGGEAGVTLLKNLAARIRRINQIGQTIWGKLLGNYLSRWKYRGDQHRRLEIGPGKRRLPGFETLNIIGGKDVDYVLDASESLPFPNGTFELIHASHVLEHIPWYKTKEVLQEWVRILKRGGILEVWVPNGLLLCETLFEIESEKQKTVPDDWIVHNPEENLYLWVNGHIFYGAKSQYPSWHRAIFTPGYLKQLYRNMELTNISIMDDSEIRGYDHGLINLGIKGIKR